MQRFAIFVECYHRFALRNAEIAHFHSPVCIQKQIARFEIAMYNGRMSRVQIEHAVGGIV